MIPPIDLLLVLVVITAGAVCIDWLGRRRRHAEYRNLALEFKMHYSPRDSLRLTPRVAAAFPIPGAAAVRVLDLLYRSDEAAHYYVFTAEYTIGVVGAKRRLRRAAAFSENKTSASTHVLVRLGSNDIPLKEQYRALLAKAG